MGLLPLLLPPAQKKPRWAQLVGCWFGLVIGPVGWFWSVQPLLGERGAFLCTIIGKREWIGILGGYAVWLVLI